VEFVIRVLRGHRSLPHLQSGSRILPEHGI
jgi:hypothetical protein